MTTEPADPYRLLDPATLDDPYPVYARLRAEAPAYFSEGWNAWLVTRYDDVLAGFRDPRLSANRAATFAATLPPDVRERLRPIIDNLASWVLFLDPPSHTRLRALLNRAFTPRLAEALRPRMQALVDGLCDRVEPAGHMDVVADLASPLPVAVIGAMLGVRPEDGHRLKGWSHALAAFLGAGRPTPDSVAAALRGIVEMEAYFRDVIADRRRSPQDDLISALVAAQDEGRLLDDRELLSTCSMVLFGGHETTTNLIGNAIHLLLSRPQERTRLRDAPTSLPAAVEEFMRYEAPVQRMGRVTTEPLEIAGTPLPKGQLVFLMLGAANRDPAHFPDPDRLDLERRDNRHLAFGLGTHYCIGAALARLETELTLGTLLRRFPDLRSAPEPAPWLRSATLRGFRSLPVLL
jgi:cytochrome P450